MQHKYKHAPVQLPKMCSTEVHFHLFTMSRAQHATPLHGLNSLQIKPWAKKFCNAKCATMGGLVGRVASFWHKQANSTCNVTNSQFPSQSQKIHQLNVQKKLTSSSTLQVIVLYYNTIEHKH